jgi:hypothetical protein
MPIEIQSTESSPPIGLVQFTFANPVIQYTIGIRAFTMTYGADDHWIQSLAIKIQPVINASVGAASNQVTANIQMTMHDASGNPINRANSEIWPVCIAVTGSPERNTVFGSAIGVSGGSDAPAQTVPMPPLGDGYSIATCFQSGFNLSFTATDHQILQANASLGFQSGQISASAGMNDSKGNGVQIATIDSGYIASSYPTPGIVATEVIKQTEQPFPVPLIGAKAAVALIRGWNVRFPSVHNLQKLKVGSFGDPTCADDVVTIQSCYAEMNDGSGNTQDNNSSSCDIVIIATT